MLQTLELTPKAASNTIWQKKKTQTSKKTNKTQNQTNPREREKENQK